MLVLSRLEGESIRIGEDIVVTVLWADKAGKVRIGIEAPQEIPIVRTELLDGRPPTGRKSRKDGRP